MRFRTELAAPSFPFSINHQHTLLCLGSCFAENMALRLAENKFKVALNPFGIVYNPLSIAQQINTLINPRDYSLSELFFENGLWHSFDHHSAFSNPEPDWVINNINKAIQQGADVLRQANVVIITLGTAFAFEEIASSRLVANCHKVPAAKFNRRSLSIEEIVIALSEVFQQLKKINPFAHILLTVSPVKHLRDGLVENQRSKARLVLAAELLCQENSQVDYFPAYEYVIDDLRDYRFFEADLAHPNKLAIDYIWEKFEAALFEDSTRHLNKRIQTLLNGLGHRPFHPTTSNYQRFVQQLTVELDALEQEFPFLDFSAEKASVRSK